MITKRLDISPENYGDSIREAARILKNEGIVAIPTETVYGLAASALSEKAIKSVFTAKGRPQDNPLIVHISDIDMLYDVAEDIPEKAIECAKRFWPGPFTMVLKRKEGIDKSVSAGLDTVAVRMPDNTVARDIIIESGLPLAAPSANSSGSPSPTAASHVLYDLDQKIDAVIMGENCKVGVESTVITLVTEKPRLLRPGAVTVDQLKEILPDIEIDRAVLTEPEDKEKVSSPGMKYKHYAPKTNTYLIVSEREKFVNFVNFKKNSGAVCFDEEIGDIEIPAISYGNSSDEKTLAKNVFSALRKADELGVNTLYIHAPSKTGVGLAVYNRLIRAAAFKVMEL
ncbi:MAG: threonylcarbamoyl-AMP synthase [Clostridia bacterium]|nr:threonylcarbamoyl-AMP synthase [Clostridia bacterium]